MLLDRRKLTQPSGPAPLHGRISDLGLLDLFTSLEDGQKTAVVRCEAPGQQARVWLREGQVVDAELGALAGHEAFWRLMTWGSGVYRVDFVDVDRAARIEGGTQGALAEALRRVDELVRAAESLPMGSHLRVDLDTLAEKLRDLPDEVNGVLRCFDGQRTLREAMDLSPVDDLSTLAVVRRLIADGILRGADDEMQRPTLQQWLSDPPPASAAGEQIAAVEPPEASGVDEIHSEELPTGAPAAQETPAMPEAAPQTQTDVSAGPPGLVHFPPLRGVRRERLRREAEDARARTAAGQPVRLTHVVELPPWQADKADAPASRFLSEAVGEAAKRFAPDLPVSRIVRTPPARLPTPAPDAGSEKTAETGAVLPEIAPVATPTPPPVVPPQRSWKWWASAAAAAAAVVFLIAGRPKKAVVQPVEAPAIRAVEAAPPAAEGSPGTAGGSKAPSNQPVEPARPQVKADAAAYAKAMEQGDALLSKGNYKAAVVELKRAVELRPTSQPALLALGDAYLEADMPKNAVEPLEAAALLDPRSSRAQLLLGTAYQSLGRNSDAVAAYQRYLTLEPHGRFSRDVQLILANLQKGR
jgi:hypothetical protein